MTNKTNKIKKKGGFLRLQGLRFITSRDRPFYFPVKCEMAIFFLGNRDFHSSREA